MEFSYFDYGDDKDNSEERQSPWTDKDSFPSQSSQVDIIGDTSDFDIIDVRRSTKREDSEISRISPMSDKHVVLRKGVVEVTHVLDKNNPFQESEDPSLEELFQSIEREKCDDVREFPERDSTGFTKIGNDNVSGKGNPPSKELIVNRDKEITITTVSDVLDSDSPWNTSESETLKQTKDKKPSTFSSRSSDASVIRENGRNKTNNMRRYASEVTMSSDGPGRELKPSRGGDSKLAVRDETIVIKGPKSQNKGKGRVTFGTVEKNYFLDSESGHSDALFTDNIFAHRKLIKMQEELTSSLRKTVKLEKQLEETLKKKNDLQLELLEADRKLSKLETRESLFREKESKFKTIIGDLQKTLGRTKEGSLANERKAARLDRLIDELNDKKRKSQEDLENANKKIDELEAQLRNVEKDYERNQSLNLRSMKELSGSSAQLEHEKAENSELRITVECLQDKLKNAEENANKAMREKATLQGELNEVKADLERWKRESKMMKLQQEEALSVADRYRTQCQEQKDIMENVMKARRQIENEVHENLILAQKRETTSKLYLQKINELEESLVKCKKDCKLIKQRYKEEQQLRKKLQEEGLLHYAALKCSFNESERCSAIESHSNKSSRTIDNLQDKLSHLRDENSKLKNDFESERSKVETHIRKLELHEREKRMLETEIEMLKLDKISLAREVGNLQLHPNQLHDHERSLGTQRDIIAGKYRRGNFEVVSVPRLSTSSLSRKDYYHSNPDIADYVSDERTNRNKTGSYNASDIERVSSLPDLSKDQEYDRPSYAYSGHYGDIYKQSGQWTPDRLPKRKSSKDYVPWTSTSYLRAKYGLLPRDTDHHFHDEAWRRGWRDSDKGDIMTDSAENLQVNRQYPKDSYLSPRRYEIPSSDKSPKITRDDDKPQKAVRSELGSKKDVDFDLTLKQDSKEDLVDKTMAYSYPTTKELDQQKKVGILSREDNESFGIKYRSRSRESLLSGGEGRDSIPS